MKIESVDFFYVSMPEITTENDGSQDALVVRVGATGGYTGWGECEASPLTSIAAYIAPMSHGGCRPVEAAVLGQPIDTPMDIARIGAKVAYDSMDLLQAPHTWSGIEMAIWDALGKARSEPVYRLLGAKRAHNKLPYASQLFGDTAEQTLKFARSARAKGFRAAKFGWGPFGRSTPKSDTDHLDAAREGLGADGVLLVDAGQIFIEDVDAAAARLPALERNRATWFEEPFEAGALDAYAELGRRTSAVAIAGGEAAHDFAMAKNLIDYGRVRFIQIDCGRIGGIGPAKRVADYAAAHGVTYVNHTFTSHLALSASIQPYAGLESHTICEYPVAPKALAVDLTIDHLRPNANGEISLPERPGLGIEVSVDALEKYRVDVLIAVNGKTLFRSPHAMAAKAD